MRAWRVGRWAGESSRGTAKTPPLQSGFCGDIIAVASRPKAAHGRRHARTMPHMETCGFYHDAACHVATVFEKFALLD